MNIRRILKNKYGLRTNLNPLVVAKRRNRCLYKVQTTDKSYALKIYERPVAIDYQLACFDQLEKNGFHQVPQVISTVDGEGSVEKGDTTFVLSEWIEGAQPSFSNVKTLKKVSAFLASFHQAAKTPEQAVIQNTRNLFTKCTTFHDIKVGQNKMGAISSKLDEWVQQFGTDPLKIARERMEYVEHNFPNDSYMELLESERKENTFIHGDFNPANLILSPNGKMYLIDFDGSSYYVRISDLLFLCHLHMGNKAESLSNILQSYHQVRPLSLTEFEIVKSLLLVPGNLYWDMHMKTYSNKPIDKDWIIQSLTRYSNEEKFYTIKKLSYFDLN